MASNDAAVLATLQAIQAQLAALPAIAADLSDLKTAVAGLDARITSVEVHGLGETPRRPAAAPQQAAVQAEAAPAVGAALPTGHQQDQQPPAAAQADDLLGDAMDLGEGGGSESQPAAPEEAADGPGVEAGTGGSQRGARQEPPTAAAGGAGQAAQPSPRRGRRLHLEPVRAAPPAQQQQQHRGDGEQQQQAETAAPVQEEEALFNSVWKPGVEGYPLAEHEDFVVAARPACRPGGCWWMRCCSPCCSARPAPALVCWQPDWSSAQHRPYPALVLPACCLQRTTAAACLSACGSEQEWSLRRGRHSSSSSRSSRPMGQGRRGQLGGLQTGRRTC